MTTTDQARATFERINQIMDERDALADALGTVLDENAALKRSHMALADVIGKLVADGRSIAEPLELDIAHPDSKSE
jgi:hypothetical protein